MNIDSGSDQENERGALSTQHVSQVHIDTANVPTDLLSGEQADNVQTNQELQRVLENGKTDLNGFEFFTEVFVD